MSPLAILIVMPVLPRVAAWLGAVRAMVLGCAIAVSGLVTMYLLPTVPVWIAARFVIGAGLALPWLAGDVWVNSVVSENSRGRVIAGYVAYLFVGFSLGPLLLDAVGIVGGAPTALACSALGLAVLPLLLVARLAPPITAEGAGDLVGMLRAVPVVAVGAFFAGFNRGLRVRVPVDLGSGRRAR